VSARQRALALADSGDYVLWPNIAAVLASEGFGRSAIQQIGRDRSAQREISARILAAEQASPTPPVETRHTRWRRNG
jgi:hypothetical protein